MSKHTLLALSLFSICSCLLVPSSVCADWLVTTDGGALETDGPWQVKGRQVIYTTTAGTLSAIRLSEVDLQRSEERTRSERSRARASASPRAGDQGAALVLTDANVGHHVAVDAPAAEEAGDEEQKPGHVDVASWQERQEPGEDVVIGGRLLNRSKDFATNIDVVVTVLGKSGQPVGRRRARVAQKALAPGASSDFEARFPDVLVVYGATFEVKNRGFLATAPSKPTTGAPEEPDPLALPGDEEFDPYPEDEPPQDSPPGQTGATP